MSRPATEKFRGELPKWDRFFSDFAGAALLPSSSPVSELQHHIHNARRRLREGPAAPVRVAFFGATGAGKSKLFSSTIGKSISASGYRRPFTRRSGFYLHDEWRALEGTLDGDIHLHHDDTWMRFLLIDTPDFDSIEQQNRAEAERVFSEADAFVFVADSLKYADASTWSYLTAIHQSEKAFVLVLNKVNSDSIVESFLERYRGALLRDTPHADPPKPIVVPEFRIQDDELIAEHEPSLQSLRRAVLAMGSDQGLTARGRLLKWELDRMMQRAETFQREIQQKQDQVEELRELLTQRLRESEQRLDERLSVSLDASVRDEVFQRVLVRIEKMDVLRYPRRILAMPVQVVRNFVTSWWRGSTNDSAGSVDGKPDDRTSTESFQMLEAEVLQLANQLRVDITGQPGFEELLTRDRFRELRPDHDELKENFRRADAQFREWVATHAKETAAEITTENKAKFFLSQLLFNSVLITAQVHSGGLSLMELGLDGVVSPVMAKGIGMLIGNEKVREFEQTARAEHRRALSEVMADVVQRFRTFLNQSAEGLDELQLALTSIVQMKGCVDDLVHEFVAAGVPMPDPLPAVTKSEPTS